MDKVLPWIAVIGFWVFMLGLSTCSGTRDYGPEPDYPDDQPAYSSTYNSNSTKATPSNSTSTPQSKPSYEDSRWPTTNVELLTIPQENRWYNAGLHVGTSWTIAGPVVNIDYEPSEQGAPVFVSIGEAYPSYDGVTLVIWSEDRYNFQEMLNDLGSGKGWIKITGYLSLYNGRMQFNTDDGYIEYTWWP